MISFAEELSLQVKFQSATSNYSLETRLNSNFECSVANSSHSQFYNHSCIAMALPFAVPMKHFDSNVLRESSLGWAQVLVLLQLAR